MTTNMDEEFYKELKQKLEKFMEAKIPVHIVLKRKPGSKVYCDICRKEMGDYEPRFLNGTLTGKKSEDFFIIDERKQGTTYVYLKDIYDVTVYEESNRMIADRLVKENGFTLGDSVSKDEINLLRNIKEE